MTRLQIIENTKFETVETVAAKLYNDGLTVAAFDMDKAKAIISRTSAPTTLLVILEEFEGVVLYHIGKFEAANS